jgi:NSS family neurotransmitter:Na+ symporter
MSGGTEGERASFSGRIGFIIAAAASAVGLGNLWRFPYLTSHFGGGIFIVVYIILALTFGFSLMVAEIAIGRKTGKSCTTAFRELSEKQGWIGTLAGIVPMLIVPYYCVIGGWVFKWFFESASGSLSVLSSDGGSFWWEYITGEAEGMGDPFIWFALFAAACVICIAIGVDKGIEKMSKILMPSLLVMIVVITAYEMTLPGIWDGIVFYLSPDVSKLSMGTFLGATSQIFYSMSLAMGIMITYGSYMRKEDSIEKSVRGISMIDTAVAILAGLLIVPSAFMFGFGDSQSMGLMFVSLPQVFAQMPGGAIVAPVFYLMVLFAAMTSAISLLEAVVSGFMDRFRIERRRSLAMAGSAVAVLGAFCILGFGPLMTDLAPFDQGAGWLGIFDMVTNSLLMPIVAVLTCAFIGFVIKTKPIEDEVEACGNPFRSKGLFRVMIRFVCPICLLAILIFGLADMFGLLSIY